MIRSSLNGAARARRGAAAARLLDVLRGVARPHRHEGRLRRGRVRLVHGAPRRRCRQRVPRRRRPVRGPRGDDRRRPRRRRRTSRRSRTRFIDEGGAQCGICTPGMLSRPRRSSRRTRSPSETRDPRGARGQPLPLHRLPAHRRVRPRRPREGARGLSAVSLAELAAPRLRAAPRPSRRLCATLVASARARGEETVLLAGGTDWIVGAGASRRSTARRDEPPLVVDVSRLAELRGIQLTGERACASAPPRRTSRSASTPALSRRAPLLAAMARDVGRRADPGARHARRKPRDGLARGRRRARRSRRSTRTSSSRACAASGACPSPSGLHGLQAHGARRRTRSSSRVEFALPAPGGASGLAQGRARGARRRSRRSRSRASPRSSAAARRALGLGMALRRARDGALAGRRGRSPSPRPARRSRTTSSTPRVERDISPIDDVRSTAAYRATSRTRSCAGSSGRCAPSRTRAEPRL